jgi:hypothetical protein
MNTSKRPFYLTGIGISLISIWTCGVALPFLLWARGPKSDAYKKKLIVWSVVGVSVMGVIGAFAPEETKPSGATESSDNTKASETTSSSPTTTEKPAPVSTGSLEDISVSSSKYLYKDCNQVDWCWQPRGTYTNTSSSRTVTYIEVVYVIQGGGAEVKHVDRMLIDLRPGRSTPIMSGEYNYSFRLEFYNDQAKAIGPLLGSSYVQFWPEVRYLRFSDGTSVGTRVG